MITRTQIRRTPTRRYGMLLSTIAALGVAGVWTVHARAEASGPDYYRVTGVAEGSSLNIRANPSVQADKVGSIPANADCVRNMGCRGGLTFEEFSGLTRAEQAERLRQNPRWCRIEYQGVTGWVAGRYLAEGGCAR